MRAKLSRPFGFLCVLLASCAEPPPPEPPKVEPPPPPPATATATATVAPVVEAPLPIPVTAADPSWGSAEAKVTLVESGDFECPFTDRTRAAIEELKETYGPQTLRVVWKNNPLPFHKSALPAARAAQTVFAVSGNDAFWSAYHALFNRQRTLADAASQVVNRAREAQPDLLAAVAAADKKLGEDHSLVESAHISGTPTFHVNGVLFVGAQPVEAFKALVDEQRAKADELLRRGVAPGRIYAELTRAQFKTTGEAWKPPPSARPEIFLPSESPVARLPVGKSPVRGPANALVTVVLVTDLACASCVRTAKDLDETLAPFKDKVRLVIKYSRSTGILASDSALHLAIEARKKKGDAGFWKVFDSLRVEPVVNDDALRRAATAAGLPVTDAMEIAHDGKHWAEIDADEEMLDEAGIGAPSALYLNGHRTFSSGEPLKKQIEGEIADAEKKVAAGTPAAKLYDKLLEQAKPVADPPKKKVPPPDKDTPGHGPVDAKVVVQIFGNFESYDSQQAFNKLAGLDKNLSSKVRIVMRHLPLSIQPSSPLAAEAAVEAFVQKGDAGFWEMARWMFGALTLIDGLERPALARYAASAGLDAGKFGAALDQHTHKSRVAADLTIAKLADIRTPTVLVNEWVVQGASAPRIRRLIRKALAEAKGPTK